MRRNVSESSDTAKQHPCGHDVPHSALATGGLKMFLSDGLLFFFLSLTAKAVAYNK